MRVYLPATLPSLEAWLAVGQVPSGTVGYAVTPGLREWYAEGDTDELEQVATLAAARASLRLLASQPTAARRRVVLAADTTSVDVLDDLDRGAVRLNADVAVRDVAAGLIDDPSAAELVARAADAVDAADLGDDDAEFVVGDAEDHPLLWFARQELPRV